MRNAIPRLASVDRKLLLLMQISVRSFRRWRCASASLRDLTQRTQRGHRVRGDGVRNRRVDISWSAAAGRRLLQRNVASRPTARPPARDNDEIGRDDATRCCQNFGSLGRPQKAASRRTPRTTGAAQTWACTLRKATILVAQAFVTVCFFASVSDVRISCTRVRNRRAFAAGTSLIYRAGRASCRRPLNSE
jgi:hypothetical protein